MYLDLTGTGFPTLDDDINQKRLSLPLQVIPQPPSPNTADAAHHVRQRPARFKQYTGFPSLDNEVSDLQIFSGLQKYLFQSIFYCFYLFFIIYDYSGCSTRPIFS